MNEQIADPNIQTQVLRNRLAQTNDEKATFEALLVEANMKIKELEKQVEELTPKPKAKSKISQKLKRNQKLNEVE